MRLGSMLRFFSWFLYMFSLLAIKMYNPKKVFSDKPPVKWSHCIFGMHDRKCSWLIKAKLIMSGYLFSELNVHTMSFHIMFKNILFCLVFTAKTFTLTTKKVEQWEWLICGKSLSLWDNLSAWAVLKEKHLLLI